LSDSNRGAWRTATTSSRNGRLAKRALAVFAFNPNPYEPMERAIGVVNRMISLGEKAQWKHDENVAETSQRSRWVQWQSATSATCPVSTEDDELLREYLALPTSEYSLLDEKFVEKISDDTFVVRVPLNDVIGVDLTPAISIVATPHRRDGKVTFVGTEATLGSPALDELFKLKVVAVLKGRKTSLQARVNVMMALSVPPRLRVIPNPLLGYAGRLITKSVLMATVPNFSSLLVSDYEKWVSEDKRRVGAAIDVDIVDVGESPHEGDVISGFDSTEN
jgi:hypothetical protein